MLKIVRTAAAEKLEMEKMQKMLQDAQKISKKEEVDEFVKKHPILQTVLYTRGTKDISVAYQSLLRYGYDDGGKSEMGMVTKTFAELDKILKGGL